MDKEDARKQTLEQLHERRKQMVRLHNKGHKVMKIVERTGLTYPTVRSAIDLFTQGGRPAIRPTPQKPIKKAYPQRQEAVKAWLDEHYRAIVSQAKPSQG
jgi:transposase